MEHKRFIVWTRYNGSEYRIVAEKDTWKKAVDAWLKAEQRDGEEKIITEYCSLQGD